MNEEDSFLRMMLADPEDLSVRQVYADWLEERGDSRAEFLRLDTLGSQGTDPKLQNQVKQLGTRLDPKWLAFVNTLGRPVRIGARHRDFFDCEPSQLPFTEPIGLRGRIMTFQSNFRSDRSWEANLTKDLRLLSELELGECAYGAACIPLHPFVCELQPKQWALTGADVLRALKARDFRSHYIQDLHATRIPYPGYNPGNGTGVDNDEIHNDFSGQYVFQKNDGESEEEVDEFSGVHGLLKRSVVDGQMWYVLLHITPEQVEEFLFSTYVILFGVGRSLTGDRLLGVVTHQVCHNLCD